MPARSRVHVVAAALMGADGKILIASRPPGTHLAGGWEFPGGKLHPGEAPLAGLSRELAEEVGIQIGPGPHRPLGKVSHSYAERDILIEAWLVRDFAGTPIPLEGQQVRWCAKSALRDVPLLPADAPLIDALLLPEVIDHAVGRDHHSGSISEFAQGEHCHDLLSAVAAEARGARFLFLDECMSETELQRLCAAVLVPVYAKGLPLSLAWQLGATGIHVP